MTDRSTRPDDATTALFDGLVDDSQWAFGTDFEDPLAGVDTTVPTASTTPSWRRTA